MLNKAFLLSWCLYSLMAVSLYDRNYHGLDWGRGGSYGSSTCECSEDQDPDCQCD